MKQIPLSQGKFATVDDEDFEFLSQWDWFLADGYARRHEYLGLIDGKQKQKIIHMHRVINQTPEGMYTDHANGNRLDNRRRNLRSATKQDNQRNKTIYRNNTSGYKGVTWDKGHEKWRAQIRIKTKCIYLGLHENKESAAKAYNQAAIKLFGEFARLNEGIL